MRIGICVAMTATILWASGCFAQSWTATLLYPAVDSSGPGAFQGEPLPSVAAEGQAVGNAASISGAALWTEPGIAVALTPSGYSGAIAEATNGSQQVGYGTMAGGSNHAMLWNGSAASYVDLNPTNLTGYSTSQAFYTNGSQQVGQASGTATSSFSHAMLWNGTANSAVDLNPTVFDISTANGTNGTKQVGAASVSNLSGPLSPNAMLWNGTAASDVNLQPTSGYTSSAANGISPDGGQEVGWAATPMQFSPLQNAATHAMLWTGSANSFVDLNPGQFGTDINSEAFETNDSVQVGYFWSMAPGVGTEQVAVLWNGSAASAVDLAALLPAAGDWPISEATSVDSSGDVFGYAIGSFQGFNGYWAVEWTPVPEPTALPVLGFLILLAAQGRAWLRRPAYGRVHIARPRQVR